MPAISTRYGSWSVTKGEARFWRARCNTSIVVSGVTLLKNEKHTKSLFRFCVSERLTLCVFFLVHMPFTKPTLTLVWIFCHFGNYNCRPDFIFLCDFDRFSLIFIEKCAKSALQSPADPAGLPAGLHFPGRKSQGRKVFTKFYPDNPSKFDSFSAFW